jgi:hypothetical protein
MRRFELVLIIFSHPNINLRIFHIPFVFYDQKASAYTTRASSQELKWLGFCVILQFVVDLSHYWVVLNATQNYLTNSII